MAATTAFSNGCSGSVLLRDDGFGCQLFNHLSRRNPTKGSAERSSYEKPGLLAVEFIEAV